MIQVTTAEGYKLFIPKESAYTITAQTILQGRIHEESTIAAILKYSQPGQVVIHAGAGFGDFLPYLKDRQVWTFEPNPSNYHTCLKTISENNLQNVTLCPDLISNEPGERYFEFIDENGLDLGVRSRITKSCGNKIFATTLDYFGFVNVGVIHLDIEGHELEALQGASELIKQQHPTIILEIDGGHIEHLKINSFMKDLGYDVVEHLIDAQGQIVFVNTVYQYTL